MPTYNIQKEDKDFYNSEKQADKFILFLKRTARKDGGFFDEDNKTNSAVGSSDGNLQSEIKYEIIGEPENKESRLSKVLDIKKNYKEIEDDYDIEEKLTGDWLKDIKKFHSSMPIKTDLPKTKSGFKINLKSPIKILMPPSFYHFLPADPDRKKVITPRSLTAPAPLALKLVTLIIVALILSVFTQLSSPKLSNKIVSLSDNIFRYPVNQLNLFAVNIYPELIAGNDKFYDQVDKIISNSKKIKSDFILENQNKLENTKNKNTYLITREELLGLPAKANEDVNEQFNKETWQEKTDIFLQKISHAVEGFLGYMSKKQIETSLKFNKE